MNNQDVKLTNAPEWGPKGSMAVSTLVVFIPMLLFFSLEAVQAQFKFTAEDVQLMKYAYQLALVAGACAIFNWALSFSPRNAMHKVGIVTSVVSLAALLSAFVCFAIVGDRVIGWLGG